MTGGTPPRDSGLIAGLLLVAACVVTSLVLLWHLKAEAGPAAPAPPRWPSASTLSRTPGRATLVMFTHPRCACTRASLAELRQLMSRFSAQLTAYVEVASPNGAPPDWPDGATRDAATSIAGVHLVVDADEREAHRFGAMTSGHVVLYDADGALRYSGGITGARGHVGDNAGLDTVAAILDGMHDLHAIGPVFGCPLARTDEGAR